MHDLTQWRVEELFNEIDRLNTLIDFFSESNTHEAATGYVQAAEMLEEVEAEVTRRDEALQ